MERISRRRRFSVFSGRSVTWLAEVFASPQRRFFPPSLLFKGERSEGNNVWLCLGRTVKVSLDGFFPRQITLYSTSFAERSLIDCAFGQPFEETA